MKLFTKEIDKKLFAQYKLGSDLANQEVVAKIFNPYGRGVWYILNSDPNDPDYLWAIVDLIDVEVGSVSRAELESIKLPPFGLKLERDLYFTPRNAKEVYEGALSGKRFAKGGTTDENAQMVLNQNKQIAHHTEELPNAVRKASHVPAWVVAKVNRSANDLSDATHYLDGERSMMAGGGNVKLIPEGQEYRYYGINVIEKDIIDKIRPQIKGLKFAGNFAIKDWKGSTDGYLYFLDDFDKKLVENIPLKHNERIYRYYTRTSAIGGMMPLVKINLDSGLVYFNEAKEFGDETIEFSKKGEKAQYINLVKATDSDYYAKGGGVEDKEAKVMLERNAGGEYFLFPKDAKGKELGIMLSDGGGVEDEGVNLFEEPENIPANVMAILEKYEEAFMDEDFEGLNECNKKLKKVGYTMDVGMGGEALNLRKIGQKPKYERGGGLSKKSTYISHRDVKEVSVERKGKVTKIKGSDIFDGFYVKNKKSQPKKEPTPAPTPAETTKNKYYVEFLNRNKNFQKDIQYFDSYQEAKDWMIETFDKFDPDMISRAYGQGGNIFDFDYSKLVGKMIVVSDGYEESVSTITSANISPERFRYRDLELECVSQRGYENAETIKQDNIEQFLKGEWVSQSAPAKGDYYSIKLMEKVKFGDGGGIGEDKEIEVSVYKNGKFSGTKKVMFMDAVEGKTLDPMSREWDGYYAIRQEDKDKVFVPKETGEDANGDFVYTEIWGLPAYTHNWFEKGGGVDDNYSIAKTYGKLLNEMAKEKQFNKRIELNNKVKAYESKNNLSIDGNNIIYIKGEKVGFIDKINNKTGQPKSNWEVKKFDKGGGVGSRFKNLLKSTASTTGKLVNRGKEATKKAIHDKKKDITLDTIWEVKENAYGLSRKDQIALENSFELVDEKYSKGGTTPKQQKKIGKVMHEFNEGDLKTSAGAKVTNPKQAVAIALSEAGVPKKGWGHKKGMRK